MQQIIDKIESRKAVKAAGHTLKQFARDNGINDDSLKAWFRGWFSENSATHKLVVRVLGEKGYLRYYEDSLHTAGQSQTPQTGLKRRRPGSTPHA